MFQVRFSNSFDHILHGKISLLFWTYPSFPLKKLAFFLESIFFVGETDSSTRYIKKTVSERAPCAPLTITAPMSAVADGPSMKQV